MASDPRGASPRRAPATQRPLTRSAAAVFRWHAHPRREGALPVSDQPTGVGEAAGRVKTALERDVARRPGFGPVPPLLSS